MVIKQSIRTYIGIAIIFIASFLATLLLPMHDIFKGIVATPAVVALFIALHQIFRDQANYEKQIELQRKQQFFSLGVTSHMAQVAFDKHVEFCDEYIAEVHKTSITLFRKDPPKREWSMLSIYLT